MDSILAIVPAFNAESTLGELLTRLRQYPELQEVVVINDGSTDATGEIAKQSGALLLEHTRNKGKGAALQTGFDYALTRSGWDAVVTIDADLQHMPEELPKFFRTRRETGADIVIGYRGRLGTRMPLPRMASNTLTSMLVSARTGLKIKDSQCGYRLIGSEVLEVVRLESEGYEAETEFLLKAARNGFRVEFIPIMTIYNNERSFMTHWETTKRFIQVLMKEY
ncbi:MAG TPA: glycosyltransferase family 2 protein [Bacteroidota bacterium]|nr:glycosyltransferase family 2 protein [Bacteroidota bacterium]